MFYSKINSQRESVYRKPLLSFAFAVLLLILLNIPANCQEEKKTVVITLDEYSRLIKQLGDSILLPIDEYKVLLQKVSLLKTDPDAKNPMSFERASYTFKPDEASVEGEAVIIMNFQKPGWYPLAGTESPYILNKMESLSVNGEPGRFMIDNSMLFVYTTKPGRNDIRLKFYLNLNEDSDNVFNTDAYIISGLTTESIIELPYNPLNYYVTGGNVISTEERKDKTIIYIQNTEPHFTFSWNRKAKGTGAALEVKPRMIASVSSLYNVSRGNRNSTDIIGIQIQKGSEKEFKIQLNKDYELTEVIGEGIESFSSKETEGRSILSIIMSKPVIDNIIFIMKSEKTDNGNSMEILPPVVMGASRQNGFIAMSSSDPLSFKDFKLPRSYAAIDTRELPGEIRRLGDNEPILGFQYRLRKDEQIVTLPLAFEFLPSFEILTDFINHAEALTLMNSDGLNISRVRYYMNTPGSGSFRLKMNPGTTLLSAYVDDKPANAAVEGNEIIIPMRSFSHEQIKTIEVVILSKGMLLQEDGTIDLELPSAAIPAREFKWNVFLPEDYDYSDISGNFMQGAIAYVPELKAAPADIGYIAPGKDVKIYAGIEKRKAEESKVEEIKEQITIASPAPLADATTGAATSERDYDSNFRGQLDVSSFTSSLRIVIPAEGVYKQFSSILMTGDKPELNIKYEKK